MATAYTTSNNSTAYINGKVYTVNSTQAWAEAFVVSPNGIFTHVGTTADITKLAHSSNMTIYDLHDQFVMPGLHDAHVHLLMSALGHNSQIRLPMGGLTNENLAAEIKKGSCLCKYTHANQDWLVAHTYAIPDFDRSSLDTEYPDTPIVIRAGAGHSAYLNTEALKRSGYSIDNEPEGQATLFMRNAKGELTGEVAENAMDKVCTSIPVPSLAHVKRSLREGIARLHKAGITSCQEASANTSMLHGLRELDAEGKLKIDLATHIVYAPDWIGEEKAETLHALLEVAGDYRSQHVDTRFVKIILDGVPLEGIYTHAGLKEDGKVDESKLFITNVHSAVQKYDAMGYTIKIHCTGHGSTRLSLDAFEAARKSNPNGPRHEIAHCSGVHDDEYPRFKPLNVTAEMSPAFFFVHPVTEASGGLMDWNFRKMGTAGAHVTIGSDWGAGADPDLIPYVANIVEAVGNGDKVAGGEKVCRMLTLSGAEAVRRDKDLGSIEVGKKANFIAVDKNLAKGEFEGANVLTTWFEGDIVYEKE